MTGRYLLLPILLCSTLYSYAQSKDETAIRKMLAAQVVAWNAGDVTGYMKGYWESDSLLFIGSKGPTYGYAATLERYLKAYPDKAHTGTLTSTVLSLSPLSPSYYFAVGKWSLHRDAGDVSGSWTLLIRKISDRWVIVCDHSS